MMTDVKWDSDYDQTEDNCVALVSNDQNLKEVESVNLQFQFGNMKTIALVDSGSIWNVI